MLVPVRIDLVEHHVERIHLRRSLTR